MLPAVRKILIPALVFFLTYGISAANTPSSWNGHSLDIPNNFNPAEQLVGLYRGDQRIGFQRVSVTPHPGGMCLEMERHTDIKILNQRLVVDLSYRLWLDWEMKPLRYEFRYEDDRRGPVFAKGTVEKNKLVNVDDRGRVLVVDLDEADPFGYWRIATQLVPFTPGMKPLTGKQFNPLSWHVEPYSIEVLKSAEESVSGRIWKYYQLKCRECGKEDIFWMREDLQIVSGSSAFGIKPVPENASVTVPPFLSK